MRPTDVWLVRHGQSFSNVEHRLCSRPPGPDLTKLGELQSQAAAERVLNAGVTSAVLLSSPLRRTQETAKPLSAALNQPVAIEAGLRETGFGLWEAQTAFDLRSDPRFRGWIQDPENTPPPSGERLSEVMARVAATLEKAARLHQGETVIGFSHMHGLLSFALYVLGLPTKEHRDFTFGNCSCVRARFDGTWHLTGFYPQPEVLPQTATS